MVCALASLLLSQISIRPVGESEPRFHLVSADISSEPRKAPKHGWLFSHRIEVLGGPKGASSPRPLFRIYSPSLEISNLLGVRTGRMLARLWDYTHGTLRLKHSPAYGDGVIDVYLCEGGNAGGEQLFGREVLNGRVRNYNAIFVYQVGSLNDPLEAAREVAHEYGHAVLPAVGGFIEPEDWGNGYLGERLFMHHLRSQIESGRITSEDTMGADAKLIAEFCRTQVEPSALQVAKHGPNMAALRAKGSKAMEAYLGLVMHLRNLLDDAAFARILVLGGSKAADLPSGVIESLKLAGTVSLRFPTTSIGTPLWIPLPKGWKASGATIARRNGEWAIIYPKSTSVTITRG